MEPYHNPDCCPIPLSNEGGDDHIPSSPLSPPPLSRRTHPRHIRTTSHRRNDQRRRQIWSNNQHEYSIHGSISISSHSRIPHVISDQVMLLLGFVDDAGGGNLDYSSTTASSIGHNNLLLCQVCRDQRWG